ncbi:hypothetical protein BX616_003593 [Lobosporangium transversale]|nr:hypothetical protein BX616_003593 [Lobosporangium transversale]
MTRRASVKVDVVQNNVEDVEWSDTESSTSEDNDENNDDGNNGGDDDVGPGDYGRRATSAASTIVTIKSTKSTKPIMKSNQETLSAPPKTKGSQQNDIIQVVNFMRETEKTKVEMIIKKMEIERIRIKMEEEREKK